MMIYSKVRGKIKEKSKVVKKVRTGKGDGRVPGKCEIIAFFAWKGLPKSVGGRVQSRRALRLYASRPEWFRPLRTLIFRPHPPVQVG